MAAIPLLESVTLRASSLEQVDRKVVDEMLMAIVKIRQQEAEQRKS